MKALSIQQPWAWLIVNGYKPVENRDWPTRFRGTFHVHAGKRIDHDSIDWIRRQFPHIPLPATFETGGIVGRARLTNCVRSMDSEWFFGEYGFVVADAEPVPFRPLRGQLGFFDVDDLNNEARTSAGSSTNLATGVSKG